MEIQSCIIWTEKHEVAIASAVAYLQQHGEKEGESVRVALESVSIIEQNLLTYSAANAMSQHISICSHNLKLQILSTNVQLNTTKILSFLIRYHCGKI